MTAFLANPTASLSAAIRAVLVAAVLVLAAAVSAAAQDRIQIEVGKSVTLDDTASTETVFIADTSVADASVSPGNRVFVFGKAVGETTLITTEVGTGLERSFVIVVTHALSELRGTLERRFPGQSISVQSARGSILVSGVVSDESQRENVIATLSAASPGTTIIDELTVAGSNLIRLRVRLLEVNRNQVERFGIDWNGLVAASGFFIGTSDRGVIEIGRTESSADTLTAAIDVLVSNGVATIAQETTLSTVNGDRAEFAVGGEIPVPRYVSDNDGADDRNFQLDYKFVGTELVFIPSRAPGNKLGLTIESSITNASGTTATVNGNSFPNLSTRRFRTNVELGHGQSFAIAGLSRQSTNADLRQGRDNGLGRAVDAIFGADTISGSNQELVVIVTPFLGEERLEQPRITELPSPLSNLEFILSGGPSGHPGGGGITPGSLGPAGFKY
ncbi:MAG: pilus assembly protein N-terminal domain-containing protein [Rhodobacteraceae bacterium]|jgi:pilus assembly protein CpaC|nr:pilus assembly protein N-terminal domain-containing protein [Paracoccaceae bacterium]